MKRSEIDDKYKWDLSLVFEQEKDFFENIKYIQKNIPSLVSYKGKLNNKNNIIEFFALEEKLSKVVGRINLYSFLKKNIDCSDSNTMKMYGMSKDLSVFLSESLAFVEPELSALDDKKIKEFENMPEMKDYDRFFFNLRKNKPHVLSEKEEFILSGIGKFADFDETFDALDNMEIKFKKVTMPDGSKEILTNASFSSLQKHDDREVRKQAYINLHKGFSNFNLTLSQNYINEIKCSNFFAKTYNFKSSFESALFSEEIDKEIYDNLIKSVNSSLPLFFEYAETKRKLLKLNKINIYDLYATIIKDAKIEKTYEEAIELVKDALSVMGSEYLSLIDRAKNEKWIDVFSNTGKDAGAFSVSCNTGNPFVLLNYQSTFDEISTMAHELGHAMHSFYSDKTQPFPKRDYVIFVAEVASTVNELMLDRYILKTSNDQNLKNYIVDSILQKYYSTIFRQTMFSEFEYNIHNVVNKDKPISFDVLNKAYSKLQKKYFGKDIEINRYAKFEWSRIPHFYRPFYVYKYATGLICAVAISEKLTENKDNYAEKYKKFLSGGCSMDPVSLLKLADVDISKKETFDYAFNFYKELLKSYKKM